MTLGSPSPTVITSQPRQDATLDNRDALIKRLNDIVLDMSKDTGRILDNHTVVSINSELDTIGLLLSGQGQLTELDDEVEQDQKDSQTSTKVGDDDLHNPLTSSQESHGTIKPSPSASSPPYWPAPSLDVTRALDISNAAEELASRLMVSVKELQKRREESEVASSRIG
jgi:hypothetical protein